MTRALRARHAIPELWIVDLVAGEGRGLRHPKSDRYAEVEPVDRRDVLEPKLPRPMSAFSYQLVG